MTIRMPMRKIHLTDVDIEDGSILYNYTYSHSISHLFNGSQFKISYNTSLSNVNESIATIPFVANVAPISWAEDIEIIVPSIDKRFADSLISVRKELNRMYPRVNFGSESANIHIQDSGGSRYDPKRKTSGSATLFSGGVDGYATYFNHREESPALLFGEYKPVDYDTHPQFKKLKENVVGFADVEEVGFNSIDSKYKQLINYSNVNLLYKDYLSNYSWWQKVQHGLFFVSSAIPACYDKGYDKLYFPSSFATDFSDGWASSASIINQISWKSGVCQHDLTDTTRQEKWELIANNVRAIDQDIIIQSCEPLPCSNCQHCARNIVGMYIEGLNPEQYGYSVADETFPNIQQKIESKEWKMESVNKYMWQDIKNHTRIESNNTNELLNSEQKFFGWLSKLNLDNYEVKKESGNLDKKMEIFKLLLNHSPTLANHIRRGYKSI